MTPRDVLQYGILPALSLLPPSMTSREAVAMMLAIGLQESRFAHRRQMAGGPARGYWQFERAGVRGVLLHPATSKLADEVAARLGYAVGIETVYQAIEHNDLLAAVFARLNLWWLPRSLPLAREPGEAWAQYLDAWRPGKPHRATWDALYAQAWEIA